MSRQEKPSILPPGAPQLVQSLQAGGAAGPAGEEEGSWKPSWLSAQLPLQCRWRLGLPRALFFPTCLQCGLSAGAAESRGWGNLISKEGEAVSPRCEPSLILPSSSSTAEMPFLGGAEGSLKAAINKGGS